jgi:hypothetical protein
VTGIPTVIIDEAGFNILTFGPGEFDVASVTPFALDFFNAPALYRVLI